MLTPEETKFISYWGQNRDREKNIARQIFFGLPFGLLLGIGVLVVLESGWYERANMVANSQSSPWLLVLAIVAIAVFTGVFYKKYKWEMNEQRYLELLVKKRAETIGTDATN
jgi:cbb3-type cytochrome oxidase subunit 3